MLTIGICGASGSGKTTLARALADSITGGAVLLAQDAYYRDHPAMPLHAREQLNYDEPDIFEHDALYEDISRLRRGESIDEKAYDYAQHRRRDTGRHIHPADVLILEGIHVFYDPRVRSLLDLKLFVQVDPDICLLRRVSRDILERGRQIEGISKQYLATVKPMYEQYIRNYGAYADMIVAQGGQNQYVVKVLAYYINHALCGAKTLAQQEMPLDRQRR